MHWKHLLSTRSRAVLYLSALVAASGISGFCYQTYNQFTQPIEISWRGFSFVSLAETNWGTRHLDPEYSFAGFQPRFEESNDAAQISVATFKVGSMQKLVAQVGKIPVLKPRQRDTLETIQAAPIERFKLNLNEELIFQNIHQGLRIAFLTAMDNQENPQEFLSAQEAVQYAALNTHVSKMIPLLAAKNAEKNPKPAARLLVKRQPKPDMKEASKPAIRTVIASITPDSEETSFKVKPEVPTHSLPMKFEELLEKQDAMTTAQAAPLPAAAVATPISNPNARVIQSGTSSITILGHPNTQAKVETPKPKWVVARNSNTQASESPATPKEESRVSTPVTPPVDPVTDKVDNLKEEYSLAEYPYEAGILGKPTVADFYLETAVSSSATDGWILMKSGSFASTLFRRASGLSKEIPLFSRNTLNFLARKAGTSHLERASQLYIRHPKGWRIEVSSRSEGQVTWNEKEELLTEQDLKNSTTTLILNVEPGQALIYLRSGEESVAIHAAFLSGTTTFIEAENIQRSKLDLEILDATQKEKTPIENVSVQAVGQPNQKEISKKNGTVRLKSLAYVQGYPIYMDVQKTSVLGQQPVNRFEINSITPQALFYFDAEAMSRWTRQLDGDSHSATGHVVASMPARPGEQSWGRIGSMLDPLHSSVESYSMDAAGMLKVSNPLDEKYPTLFGSELGDDIYRLEMTDANKAVTWSKFLFASPGVVSVIRSH